MRRTAANSPAVKPWFVASRTGVLTDDGIIPDCYRHPDASRVDDHE
jgi:hypothetical protein